MIVILKNEMFLMLEKVAHSVLFVKKHLVRDLLASKQTQINCMLIHVSLTGGYI